MQPKILAVAAGSGHDVWKPTRGAIELIAGEGVAGDAHRGVTVKHRSRVRVNPHAPNLRQVHLLHAELFDELAAKGFTVAPGAIGENVTTQGLDLLALPTGTHLYLGAEAVVEVTGLRNPCNQIDGVAPGLMAACLDRDADGRLVRKAGIMAVVVTGGAVRPGDSIQVELPEAPHRPLAPV